MKHNKKPSRSKSERDGTGMSFITNRFMTKFLSASSGNHGVIIDVGESYRKMCETLRAKKP